MFLELTCENGRKFIVNASSVYFGWVGDKACVNFNKDDYVLVKETYAQIKETLNPKVIK